MTAAMPAHTQLSLTCSRRGMATAEQRLRWVVSPGAAAAPHGVCNRVNGSSSSTPYFHSLQDPQKSHLPRYVSALERLVLQCSSASHLMPLPVPHMSLAVAAGHTRRLSRTNHHCTALVPSVRLGVVGCCKQLRTLVEVVRPRTTLRARLQPCRSVYESRRHLDCQAVRCGKLAQDQVARLSLALRLRHG